MIGVMRMRAWVAVVGLLLAALAVDAIAATQVRSVRLWRAPDNTRLVFDLSGTVQHSVFTLTPPLAGQGDHEKAQAVAGGCIGKRHG